MLYSRPPVSDKRTGTLTKKSERSLMGSVGQELHHLEKERAIQTDPAETRRRRTIQLLRNGASDSWGFTLQTYGIRNKRDKQVEVMTYVDYVELNGPAWIAGMQRGDVLLSVNGEMVEGLTHPQLVGKIQLSSDKMRLVVLFEDCCRKVELYERYIKLKRILSQKMSDLRRLELQERQICSGDTLSRLGLCRGSVRSSTSSDWDCYSQVLSPGLLDSTATNQRMWRQHFFAHSTDTLDTSSDLSYPSPFGSSRESLNGSQLDCTPAPHRARAHSNDSSDKTSQYSSGTEQSNGACGGADRFYIGSDTPKLRRAREEPDAEPPPAPRKRSNSALLNDMRMLLIADVVNTQVSAAPPEDIKEELEGDRESRESGGCESEITVVRDDDNVVCRLYRGVRINERDEDTKL